MIRLVLWKWMASFPCRAILLFFRIISIFCLPSSTPLLCESTRIDTHVDLSFGNERRNSPHNWPLAAVLGKIWGHLSITTSRLDSSPLSSSYSFEDIKPNGQSLLCSTKLYFFNSSSRRSLTRGQPWGKSLKWCDGLTYYFGRPGAILTYLDIEAQHCPRELAELIVFGTIILVWAVPQFLSNSKLITEDPSLDVCICIARHSQLRRGLTTQKQFHYDVMCERIRIRIELGPIWSQQIELFLGSIALGTRLSSANSYIYVTEILKYVWWALKRRHYLR